MLGKPFADLKIRNKKLSEILQELLWIYRYGLKYRRSILWYICLGIVGTVFGLAGSVISKNIIDAVTGFHVESLVTAIVAYAFFQICTIGLRALEGKVSLKIEIRAEQEIRADIYAKIMEADWEALSAFHSGDLLSRVNKDVSSVSSSVIGWIPDLFTRVLQFAGTFFIIMYYDPAMALLALLAAPATLLVSRSFTRRMRAHQEEMNRIHSETMVFQEESFRNVQLIKSFGAVDLFQDKLSQIQEKRRTIRLNYQNFTILSNICLSVLGLLVTGVCCGWGLYRLWSGHITYGTMVLFLQLAGMLRGSFAALVHMVPKTISAAASAGRLMDITALPQEQYLAEEEAAALIRQNSGIVIRAEDVTFRYRSGREVLFHADFFADPGDVIALIGPSGEGKTTMLRILLGMVSVCGGCVEVGETGGVRVPVSAATRGLFAYVPQDNVMFFDTIAENMRIVNRNAGEQEILDALRQACADDFVEALPDGIYSRVGENGGGFSEGQIQRLAIARALLSPAPVILLDEATSALDADTERKILHNIMKKNRHRTLIFVTHRMGILPLCSKVCRIEQKTLKTVTGEEITRLAADNGYESESRYN